MLNSTTCISGVPMTRTTLHSITTIAIILLMVFASASVAAQNPTPTPEDTFGLDPNARCAESRLKVGDLQNIDDTILPEVARAAEEAQVWQADARVFTLRLGCPLLVTGVKWEGVFFSEAAQAMYETDTGRVEPVELDPELIPTLVPASISMTLVYDSLIEYGFTDDLLLTPAGGVTIRTSTSQMPFGPETAPVGHVYAHVAIERQHEIIDVWIDMNTGELFTYWRQ